jgi:G3E family GTPase
MDMRVNLLFGFLGSGKTTLVRRLLAERGRTVKTAVIVNEFGEVGVDGDILRGNNVDIVELNSGCLCCTLRGSLMLAVEELRSKAHVERVIVEATGVAQPGELTETLTDSSLKLQIDIGPLVTVVDAAKFPKLITMLGEFYVAQIENADIIVVNKADLVTAEQLEEVGREIRDINAHADILFAEHCDVDSDYLLELHPGGLLGRDVVPTEGSMHQPVEDAHHAAAESHSHDHEAHGGAPAESFVLVAGENPDRTRVEQFFQGLPESVWRAKGFMNIGGTPCLVQYTMGQLEISRAAGVPSEKIVFIGRQMDQADIEARFAFAKRN